jgi:hypothetical protein
MLKWEAGAIMAFSSLFGIGLGIYFVFKIQLMHYKRVLVVFYSVIFSLTAYKIIVG